jgi:CheY-like chemotaxis protein
MTPRSVLLIEDDPDVSIVSAEMLRAAGFDVVIVDRVSAALAACGERVPDAAVVDLRLPGESGWSFIRRSRELWPDVKLVIYTVHSAEPEVVAEARALGVEAVIDKSEDPALLIETLRREVDGAPAGAP